MIQCDTYIYKYDICMFNIIRKDNQIITIQRKIRWGNKTRYNIISQNNCFVMNYNVVEYDKSIEHSLYSFIT